MKFQTNLFVLLVSVSSAFASTAANVKADLVSITAATNKLDAQIVAYPATGGTLAGALAIHTNSTALITLVDTGKTDAINVTPKPSSVADATDIIGLVTTLKPSIHNALIHIVDKKPAFAALPLGNVVALVKGDLVSLNASTIAFANALVAATPSTLVAQATTLKNDIAGYFAVALAAYA